MRGSRVWRTGRWLALIASPLLTVVIVGLQALLLVRQNEIIEQQTHIFEQQTVIMRQSSEPAFSVAPHPSREEAVEIEIAERFEVANNTGVILFDAVEPYLIVEITKYEGCVDVETLDDKGSVTYKIQVPLVLQDKDDAYEIDDDGNRVILHARRIHEHVQGFNKEINRVLRHELKCAEMRVEHVYELEYFKPQSPDEPRRSLYVELLPQLFRYKFKQSIEEEKSIVASAPRHCRLNVDESRLKIGETFRDFETCGTEVPSPDFSN
jgi:hypothetical protein